MKRVFCALTFSITLLLALFSAAAQTDVFTDRGVTYTVERYVTANYPVALAFAPDGRLFYTEKITGNVRVVSADGELQREPVITLPVDALMERGMLGIALDPDYAENGHIWVVHTHPATARDWPANNLVRFREQNGRGADPEVMLSLPIENGNLLHNGGNVHFDSEGYLYLSVGDYGDAASAQNLDTAQGKIHRFVVTNDGLRPAPGNPFENNSIYAYGLRNPWDFAFDPETGRLFATENGEQCDDEINLILPGFHYGWGENYTCGGTAQGVNLARYLPPLISYTPPEAPTGITFYDHEAAPEWRGHLFFCTWNSGRIVHAVLDERRTAVEEFHEMDTGEATCRIDIVVGPDGAFYFSTVSENSGAIYRLAVVERDQ